MSWPTVSPATWVQASASATRSAVRPMTATSSTSQSLAPPTTSMSSKGPLRLAGNFVKTIGTSGSAMPDSSAWLR